MYTELLGQMARLEHATRIEAAESHARHDYDEAEVSEGRVTPAPRRHNRRIVQLLGFVGHRRGAVSARPVVQSPQVL